MHAAAFTDITHVLSCICNIGVEGLEGLEVLSGRVEKSPVHWPWMEDDSKTISLVERKILLVEGSVGLVV